MLVTGVNAKIGVKTKDTQNQFENSIENLTQSSESVDDMFNSLKDRVGEVLTGFKALCDALDSTQNKLSVLPTKTRKDELTPKNEDKKNDKSSLTTINNMESTALSVINSGDITNSIAKAIKSGGTSLFSKGIEVAKDDEDLAKLLKKVGAAGLAAGATVYVGNALSKKYEEKLPIIDNLIPNFGGPVNQRSASENSAIGLELFNRAAKENIGTGLDNIEFLNLISSVGKNAGITNEDRAISIAKTGVNFSRMTGTDYQQTTDFMSLIERLGGNGTSSISRAYKAAEMSGLKPQQFGEFLDGIQSVIEKGISQGFIKSAKDVSESLSFLAKISGDDPLWKGKYGVQRYEQMASGMANATSLSNVSQLLMYQAAKGITNDAVLERGVKPGSQGDWMNTMVMLESGDVSADFLKSLKNKVESVYGTGEEFQAQRVKTYMEQFGLNWTGGIAVDKLLQNINEGDLTPEEKAVYENQIKEIQNTAGMKSDKTVLQDAMSKLDKVLTDLGHGAFGVKVAGLQTIERTTTGIYNLLHHDKDIPDYLLNQMFDMETNDERTDWEQISKDPNKLFDLRNIGYQLTPAQLSSANQLNLFQKYASGEIDIDKFYELLSKAPKGSEYYNQIRNKKVGNTNIMDIPLGEGETEKERKQLAIQATELYFQKNGNVDANDFFNKSIEVLRKEIYDLPQRIVTGLNNDLELKLKE